MGTTYAMGDGTVVTLTTGKISRTEDIYTFNGNISFAFSDIFQDPLDDKDIIDQNIELPFSTPYFVTGKWRKSIAVQFKIVLYDFA